MSALTKEQIADVCDITITRLEGRCSASKSFAIGEPFAQAIIYALRESSKALRSLESAPASKVAAVSECCDLTLDAGTRFCHKCGWECRAILSAPAQEPVAFGPIDGNWENTALENWFPYSAAELERLRTAPQPQAAGEDATFRFETFFLVRQLQQHLEARPNDTGLDVARQRCNVFLKRFAAFAAASESPVDSHSSKEEK